MTDLPPKPDNAIDLTNADGEVVGWVIPANSVEAQNILSSLPEPPEEWVMTDD